MPLRAASGAAGALVIGNVALDESFAVDAFPQPGESVFGRLSGADLGGKGANQAVAMARFGLPVRLIAPVGSDSAADNVRRALAAEPLTAALVPIPGVATDRSVILTTADGENAIITTAEAAESLTPDAARAAVLAAAEGTAVVLQGNLAVATTEAALRAARDRGAATILNPSPLRPGFAAILPMADIVFVNTAEALALTGERGPAAADALRAMGLGTVVLTQGADGALLATSEGIVGEPAKMVSALDTTGAGDSFLGAMVASALLRGALDVRALRHGIAAAAVTVTRRGTCLAIPTREEATMILTMK